MGACVVCRNKKFLTLALLGLLGPFPALAIELPDFGDSASASVSPEQERRLGRGLFRHLKRNERLVNDPEIEAYVQSLGSALTAQAENAVHNFEFFLVGDPTLNAFAAPGGFIGIHTGLLLHTETESELAGVVAHEIAHVTQRHMARTFEKASQLSIPMAAAMLGAILLGTQNPEAGQAAFAAIAAGNAQYQLNFTRSHEEEADRIGMQILAQSGFDPRGMPSFFERMQRANRLTDNAQLPEFLRTHPVSVTRIADSRNRAEQYPTKHHRDSLAFHLVRTKLRLSALGQPAAAVAYFERQLKSGLFLNAGAARYGYALALTEAGSYREARRQLEQLRHADPEQTAYLLAAARLALAEKRPGEALSIYGETLKLYPNYRPAVLGQTQTLLTTGQAEEARRVLRNYALSHEVDGAYYGLLAEAEGKLGAEVEAQIALGEQSYLAGETHLARDQLCFARRSPLVDHYQRQRIEARLKNVLGDLIEEQEAEQEGSALGRIGRSPEELDPARPCPG